VSDSDGAAGEVEQPGAFAALSHPNFRMFWIAGIISNSGRFFQAVAIPLVVYDLTESAAWVGLAGFAQLLPTALLGPLAGAIADRYARRRILLVTQSLQGIAALGFMALWFGGVRSPTVYVLASVIAGAAAGLNLPAWQAFVSELVPRDTLMSAITLNSAQFNTARLLGPMLAGIVIHAFGPGWAFTVNAFSYLATIGVLALMRLPRVHPEPTDRMRPIREFIATVGYVRTKPGIVTAVATVSLIGFFGLASQMMSVVVAEEVFDRGERGFGEMLSAVGLGAIIASPVVAKLAGRTSRAQIQRYALVLYGLGIIGTGLAPTFRLAQLGLFFVGMAHIASASTLNTAIQLQVDEHVRAKVLSVYLTVLLLANPLGQLVMGQSMEVLGPQETYIIAGAALLVVALSLMATGRLEGLDTEGGTYVPAAAAEAHPSTPAPPRASTTSLRRPLRRSSSGSGPRHTS
jgi:MFS family permease